MLRGAQVVIFLVEGRPQHFLCTKFVLESLFQRALQSAFHIKSTSSKQINSTATADVNVSERCWERVKDAVALQSWSEGAISDI